MTDQELIDAVEAITKPALKSIPELLAAIEAIEEDSQPCLADAACCCQACVEYIDLCGDLQDAEDAEDADMFRQRKAAARFALYSLCKA